MKILLLGENGYLGSFLQQHLTADTLESAARSRKIYDNGLEYDYVINCIGKADLEYCESNPLETDYSNRDVINDISEFYPESKIINFSSYYVYNEIGLCDEEANVTNQYAYCRQKLEGEKLVNHGVSFRLGKLFGHDQQGKQHKLTEHILSSENLVLDQATFNPTSLHQVLRVINFELTEHALNGVINLANEGCTSHYDYGVYINDTLNAGKVINSVERIDRTFDNYGKFAMSCAKLQQYIDLTPWQDDLADYLEHCSHR